MNHATRCLTRADAETVQRFRRREVTARGHGMLPPGAWRRTGCGREELWRERICATDVRNHGADACMNPNRFSQFAHQTYLNLETSRTLATAGKVKRIRNNLHVRIVPCDVRGHPTGAWVDATARILAARGSALGHQLLNQKYGWIKRIGDAVSRLRRRPRVVIAIDT